MRGFWARVFDTWAGLAPWHRYGLAFVLALLLLWGVMTAFQA